MGLHVVIIFGRAEESGRKARGMSAGVDITLIVLIRCDIVEEIVGLQFF